MTAPARVLDDESEPAPSYDRRVMLQPATWADYQRLLAIRGEKAVPRLSYLEGKLEIMVPSYEHEGIKSMIGRLVEAWCMHHGVDLSPVGSWTLEDKAVERGAEPDECYVFGEIPEKPERPDLAIEVVWTSGGLDELEIYRKLGVREVWTWKRGRIHVHELVGERYEERERSVQLPDLDLLLQFVEVRPMTRAVRQLLAALPA